VPVKVKEDHSAILLARTKPTQGRYKLIIPQAVADSKVDAAATGSSSLLPPAISIDNLSCTHNGGETWQFKEASFVIQQGAKAALIGINGSGKSTLLRILAENTCGDDSFVDTSNEGMVYTGTVSSPRTLKVAYVEQEVCQVKSSLCCLKVASDLSY
jgi:ATPase subunit of ABC transporter with duplicated ATPase domains